MKMCLQIEKEKISGKGTVLIALKWDSYSMVQLSYIYTEVKDSSYLSTSQV